MSASTSPISAPTRLLTSALVAVALLWPAPSALAQFTQYSVKRTGGGAIGAARQGWSVAVSGDGTTAIIGGPNDNSFLGAVWVFTKHLFAWTQQGGKLVGGNNVGEAREGSSVALSADGNVAIVGGPADNGNTGAAWIFTRSGGVWNQQGAKLVGSGAIGAALQGESVALSADGNTALVGGHGDNSGAGAAWVFTRNSGTWTEQTKLIGTGAVGAAGLGTAVALSADGNTAIIGGMFDNSQTGAAWVFTRSGGVWTQQQKLIGTGAAGAARQGNSVALSADGNTALVGGPDDQFQQYGASWVFTRSNGMWNQQGGKLVGTGATAYAHQGSSVALSADGNTAMVGGPDDNNGIGAAWAFVRSGVAWAPLGNKLVGTDVLQGGSGEGQSVALSQDGNTAIVGGPFDSGFTGAMWVYYQPSAKVTVTATHDFDRNQNSDLAWRQSGGTAAIWLLGGQNVIGSGSLGVVPTSWQIVGQRDFNNDGRYDWLWRDSSSGTVAIWLLSGLTVLQSGTVGAGAVQGNWVISGTSDFNYDGRGDILWYDNNSGTVAIWLMDGLSVLQAGVVATLPGNWKIEAADGKGNIFWRDNSTGALAMWEVYGFQVLQAASLGTVPLNWAIVGTGDFDGDGSTDILWRDSDTGTLSIWLMGQMQILQTGSLGAVPLNWVVANTGDLDGDGRSDIFWRDTSTGAVAVWYMHGLSIFTTASFGTVTLDWTIQGLNAD